MSNFNISTFTNCIFFSGLILPDSGCALKKILYQLSFKWNTIVLFIDSEGGDVQTAHSLFDHIKSINCEIITVADGTTQSSAVLIFMAGCQRYIMPHCFFRPHQNRYQIRSIPYKQLNEEFQNCSNTEKQTRNIYKEILIQEQKCNLNEFAEEVGNRKKGPCNNISHCIDELFETEIMLSIEQTIQFGFVHDIWNKQYHVHYVVQ